MVESSLSERYRSYTCFFSSLGGVQEVMIGSMMQVSSTDSKQSLRLFFYGRPVQNGRKHGLFVL